MTRDQDDAAAERDELLNLINTAGRNAPTPNDAGVTIAAAIIDAGWVSERRAEELQEMVRDDNRW